MPTVTEHAYSSIEGAGWRARVVPARHVAELREEIADRRAQGHLAPEVFQEGLSHFRFEPPETLPQAASLIIVAAPRPRTRVSFTRHGRTTSIGLPPIFLGFKDVARQIRAHLADALATHGFHIAPARLPQKLLAVRSGLAEYGRNNIAYIPGLGSLFQIDVCWSDLPCATDTWGEPRVMERCKPCGLCRTHCPTGAITDERFLISADRCLVFHNERGPEHPFPAWIDPAWHNCLVGCMLCQGVCPANRGLLGRFEGNESFTEEETALLMQGTTADRLGPDMVARLARLDLLDYLAALPRNLGVFLGRAAPTR